MKRAIGLVAMLLAACQPQMTNQGASSSPAHSEAVDRIYVHHASGGRLIELDWSGRTVGSVPAPGFATPSADGSKFMRTGPHPTIEDWRGRAITPFDSTLSLYAAPVWADDNTHLCGIEYPANGGADQTKASVWILTPGQTPHVLASVDVTGSPPAVQACSMSNNRVVIAAGAMPHWPPGATRYLITTRVSVLNLTTGVVEYQHDYPQGNMGGQRELGPRGDWVLATVSPDGRYLAETGVFNGRTDIREMTRNRVVASVSGIVVGFSADGSRLVNISTSDGVSQIQVIDWADQHIVWRISGTWAGVLARPKSSDLLVGVSDGSPTSDLYAISGRTPLRIATDADINWMCPCYPGA